MDNLKNNLVHYFQYKKRDKPIKADVIALPHTVIYPPTMVLVILYALFAYVTMFSFWGFYYHAKWTNLFDVLGYL